MIGDLFNFRGINWWTLLGGLGLNFIIVTVVALVGAGMGVGENTLYGQIGLPLMLVAVFLGCGLAGFIVAKIADVGWKVPTKLLGNYDRIVDVYDPQLANDKNFGLTLSLLSQFMTHQGLYRENRLQQLLPSAGPPGGADDDVAI